MSVLTRLVGRACGRRRAFGLLAARTAQRAAQEFRLLVHRRRGHGTRTAALLAFAVCLNILATRLALEALGPVLAVAALETVVTLRTIRPILTVETVMAVAPITGETSIATLPVPALMMMLAVLMLPFRTRTAVLEPRLRRLAAFPRRTLEDGRLRLVRPYDRLLGAFGGKLLAFTLTEIIAGRHRILWSGPKTCNRWLRAAIELARLLHLLAIGENDAVVVLGVLQIVLGEDGIARGLRIAGERHVFLGDMSRRAADLGIWPGRFEASRQRILATPAIVLMVIVATASTAVLLALPHEIHSQLLLSRYHEPLLAPAAVIERQDAFHPR